MIFRRRRAAAAAAHVGDGGGVYGEEGRRPRIQLAVGPQPLWLRNHNSELAHRIMVKRLATSPHDPLGITDIACKNQLVVVSVQYDPFNPYIPIRSTTIGKSRVAIDPIAMHTSWRSNSDIASVTSIEYPRMSASGEPRQRCIDSYMHWCLTQSRRLVTPNVATGCALQLRLVLCEELLRLDDQSRAMVNVGQSFVACDWLCFVSCDWWCAVACDWYFAKASDWMTSVRLVFQLREIVRYCSLQLVVVTVASDWMALISCIAVVDFLPVCEGERQYRTLISLLGSLATMRRVVNYHSSWARQQQVELFDASGNPGSTAGRGFNPAGGAPGGG
ncbi:hypothetical protein F511_43607 [Dorcoceras hygrometricum]|uniref:Uncharacterized protein n=1 Tax=Dorcoceras hygrometricum TaxID=472368 RepID=A0A2Z7CFE1_9LAMI|nr:hypothetical protein F511_43607 [Dorcoceras hygrometricum]